MTVSAISTRIRRGLKVGSGFEAAGIGRLAQLGELSSPLPFTPSRGAVETYIRLREQARVQLEGRINGQPVHELLLPIEVDQGLARLPEPSAGDIGNLLDGVVKAADELGALTRQCV